MSLICKIIVLNLYILQGGWKVTYTYTPLLKFFTIALIFIQFMAIIFGDLSYFCSNDKFKIDSEGEWVGTRYPKSEKDTMVWYNLILKVYVVWVTITRKNSVFTSLIKMVTPKGKWVKSNLHSSPLTFLP